MPTTTEHGPFTVAREEVRTNVVVRAGDIVQVVGQGVLDLGGGFLFVRAPQLTADGDDWQTPADYPAPALRKNSLIWRTGSRWFQGGSGAVLWAECSEGGEIVLFVNDSNALDNSGGWTVTVRVTSPWPSEIEPHYLHLGGAGGFLGGPTSDEGWTEGFRGRYRHFAGGSLYWSPQTGCREVHGAIRELYGRLHWERGFLGYPTTDETPARDGVGRYNHFEGGSIYWTPATGAHEVHGAIRARWQELGSETSFLRYPTTDELVTPWDPRGRYNEFFAGQAIYWSPESGAWALSGPIREAWLRDPRAAGFPTANQGYTRNNEGLYAHFQWASIYSSAAGTWLIPAEIRRVYEQERWEHGELRYPVGPAARPRSAGGSPETVLFQPFQGGGICLNGRGARRVAAEIDCRPSTSPAATGGTTGGTAGSATGTLTLHLARDPSIESIDGAASGWTLHGPRGDRLPLSAQGTIDGSGGFTVQVPFPSVSPGDQRWSVSCRARVYYENPVTRVRQSTDVVQMMPLRPAETRLLENPFPFDWFRNRPRTITFLVAYDNTVPALGFMARATP